MAGQDAGVDVPAPPREREEKEFLYLNDTPPEAVVQAETEGMSTKEDSATAREFTLALPEDVEGLVFAVRGFPLVPDAGGRAVLWVRAREGVSDWGQSAYVQADRHGSSYLIDHYDYRSHLILPGTLWITPGRTYVVEVTCEGLEDPEIEVRCVRRAPPPPRPEPSAQEQESIIDNPFAWLFLLIVLFVALLLRVIH